MILRTMFHWLAIEILREILDTLKGILQFSLTKEGTGKYKNIIF